MPAEIYTTAEMVELVGVSYSTLHRWVRRGLLSSPRKCSNGNHGVWLEWTRRQALAAKRLAAKSRAGRQ